MDHREFEVNINDYEISKCPNNRIGAGSASTVFIAENKNSKKKFAAKVIMKKYSDEDNLLRINREIEILVSCVHPTIIKFYGFSKVSFNGTKKAVIFMELEKNGSLSKIIKKSQENRADSRYNNTKKQIILIGIAYGMTYLNKRRIIHRDLKPDNILLDDNFYPKISDFNLSKACKLGDSLQQSATPGSSGYAAPEVYDNCFSFKADVFSFGIIMYEILYNKYPFAEKIGDYKKPSKDDIKIEWDPSTKIGFKDLIEKCLKYDSRDRPSFAEIYEKLSDIENDDNYCLENVDKKEVKDYIKLINNDDQKDDIYTLKAAINYLEDQNDNLTENFEQETFILNNRISKLEGIIQKMVSKNDDNDHLDDNLNEKIENLEKKIDDLQKCQKSDEFLDDSSEKVRNDDIMSIISDLQENMKQLSQENEDLKKRISTIEKVHSKSEIEKDDLEQKVDELRENVENIKEIEDKVTKIENDCRKINGLLTSMNELKEKIGQITNQQSLFNQEKASCLTKDDNIIVELQRRVDNHDKEIEQLKRQLASYDSNNYSSFTLKRNNSKGLFIQTTESDKGNPLSPQKSSLKNLLDQTAESNKSGPSSPQKNSYKNLHLQQVDDDIDGPPSPKKTSHKNLLDQTTDNNKSGPSSPQKNSYKNLHLQQVDDDIDGPPSPKKASHKNLLDQTTNINKNGPSSPIRTKSLPDQSNVDNTNTPRTTNRLNTYMKKGKSGGGSLHSPLNNRDNWKYHPFKAKLQNINESNNSGINTLLPSNNIPLSGNINTAKSSGFLPKEGRLLNLSNFNQNDTEKAFMKIVSSCPEAMKLSDYIKQIKPNINMTLYIEFPNEKEPKKVKILLNATDLLFSQKKLVSSDFIEIIDLFDQFIFELRYPFQSFDLLYQEIEEIKNKVKNNERIFIHLIVTSFDKIQSSLNNKTINLIKINKQITNSALKNCYSISSVSIASSLIEIGEYAFSGCLSLSEIDIPPSITSIGQFAFSGCSSLSKLSIPSSVTTIGNDAFSNCSQLFSVNIPPSLNLISQSLFRKCALLTEVTIPSSILKICDFAFEGCKSLKTVVFQDPSNVESIGRYAFYNCTHLTNISIPNSINEIDDGAFENCSSIPKLSTSSVKKLGKDIFKGCY